jgi:hypothetical protein
MNSLTNKQHEFIATDVFFTEDAIGIQLSDGRVVYAPLEFYPRLKNATHEQRQDYELIGLGTGIHWKSLDEDLSVAGIVLGDRSII